MCILCILTGYPAFDLWCKCCSCYYMLQFTTAQEFDDLVGLLRLFTETTGCDICRSVSSYLPAPKLLCVLSSQLML